MPTPSKKVEIFKLGIIAGGGRLPEMLLKYCHDVGMEPYVLAFKGHTDPALVENVAHDWTHLGALQQNIDFLKSAGLKDLVFCGDIKRPSFRELKLDRRAAKFVALKGFKALGDNDLLTSIKAEISKDGFVLHGVHEFIEDILSPAGLLGEYKPSAQDFKDIEYGFKISQELGRLDIGQSVIVQDGFVIGVEAIEGTDSLIKRVKPLLKVSEIKGVLVKTCKPQQDKNLDLPTIGIQTLEHAAEVGLAGIAFHAGKSLVLDLEHVIAYANKNNLFLYGIES